MLIFFYRIFFLFAYFSLNIYAQNLQKVSLQLNWKYQFEFAGFIAAKEKGFYKDVGLDVELKEYQFGMNIVQDVLDGKSTFGISNSTRLLDYLEGKPIALVSSILKKSALVIVTKPYIKTPQDLIGKKLMVTPDDMEEFSFMFEDQHIDISKITLVKQTFNIKDFVNGKVDAMSAFRSDQLYKLDKLGIKYNIIDPSDYGMYSLQCEVFTTKHRIQYEHKLVEKFNNASIKGWKYALAHKDELVDIIYNKYSKGIPKDELRDEADIMENLIFPQRYDIGYIDKDFLKKQFRYLKAKYHIKTNKTIDGFLYEKDNHILYLTDKERNYLKHKKVLTVCVKKDWLPYESILNGKFIGISADFLSMYTKKLNIDLKVIVLENQSAAIRALKNKRCDIKPLLLTTKDISIPYKPTSSYFSDTISLVTRLEQGYIQNLNSIKQPLLVAQGYHLLLRFIAHKYPNITLKIVPDTRTALKMVADGKAFGYIGTSLHSSHIIQKYFSYKLKIINSFRNVDFGFGINEDDKILMDIFNIMILDTTEIEKNNILNKWIATTVEKTLDYKSIILFLGIVGLFIIFLLYRNSLIKLHNQELKEQVENAIDETKKAEQHLIDQAKFAQMGEMLSMIAHQWRQPLAAIGSVNMAISMKARMGILDNKTAQELSDSISVYLEHLSTTIDDFRDFFKPTKKKRDVTYTQLIDDTLKIIDISIKNQNIKLIKELNSDVVFHTYPNELKQVLLNLLKNAKDALVENNIQDPYIKIETYGTTLRVIDNGGGIKDDIKNKIFNPYFSTKTAKNGTGLGLYMSKLIIEEHCGGTLSVSSEGTITIFTIDLIGGKNE